MADTVPAVTDGAMTSLKELFTVQIGRFGDKVDNLAQTVRDGFADLRKVLDDHEKRLREQGEADSKQNREIGDLRVEVVKLSGDVQNLRQVVETVQRNQEAGRERTLNVWQQILIEVAKMAVFGGSFGAAGGGIVMLVLKNMGVV